MDLSLFYLFIFLSFWLLGHLHRQSVFTRIMRCPDLCPWLLPAAFLAASLPGVQAQERYTPRPLNDTVEALGLSKYLANYEAARAMKRSVSNRCQDAVCLDEHFF